MALWLSSNSPLAWFIGMLSCTLLVALVRFGTGFHGLGRPGATFIPSDLSLTLHVRFLLSLFPRDWFRVPPSALPSQDQSQRNKDTHHHTLQAQANTGYVFGVVHPLVIPPASAPVSGGDGGFADENGSSSLSRFPPQFSVLRGDMRTCTRVHLQPSARVRKCERRGERNGTDLKTRRRGWKRRASSQEHSQGGDGKEEEDGWDRWTGRMVDLSAGCFAIMQVPQMARHTWMLQQGALAEMRALSVPGVACSLVGNAILMHHFARRGEAAAVRVQAFGTCSGSILLAQIAAAGHLKAWMAVLAGTFAVVATGTAVWRILRNHEGSQWKWWDRALALVGCLSLGQVWAAVTRIDAWLVAAFSTCAWTAALVWEDAQYKKTVRSHESEDPPNLEELWERRWEAISSWSATLLFMLMPVAQVAKSFAEPWTVEGIAMPTVFLGWVGNALMLPRALATRDLVWVAGSAWGATVFGWCQGLAMTRANIVMNKSVEDALVQKLNKAVGLPLEIFLFSTAVYGTYLITIFAMQRRKRPEPTTG
eukprot:scaffold456_cov368-Pavlova_lutheri.AAC.2